MDTIGDIQIWREVLATLKQDERIDASNFTVSVTDGVVSLVGNVASFPEKALVAQLVSRVQGVTGMRNELLVVPAELRTDGDIAADIQAALEQDVRVNIPERITVVVENGIVTLSGSVGSFDEKMSVSDDVQSVPGVIDVMNNLDVIPGVIKRDAEIQNDLRRKLIDDIIVDASSIHISVHDGMVTLSGTVPGLYQRQAAEDDAWSLDGVRGVVNELRVTSAPSA